MLKAIAGLGESVLEELNGAQVDQRVDRRRVKVDALTNDQGALKAGARLVVATKLEVEAA